MATINPVDPRTPTGAAKATSAAAGGGDVIPMQPGKTYMVVINNADTNPITASLNDPASGGTLKEFDTVPIAASSSRVFPFKRKLFGAQPTADVALTYSAVTSVTVECYGPIE